MTSDTHSHVKAEPIEAPQERPRYTYAQHKARVKAWQTIAYSGEAHVLSFGTLNAAIDAYEESLRQQHRSAAEQIR